MHNGEGDVTSGYETISSSNEDWQKSHLASTSIKVAKSGQLPGLIASHGDKKGTAKDADTATKDGTKPSSRSKADVKRTPNS
jgi:hypothetical protein